MQGIKQRVIYRAELGRGSVPLGLRSVGRAEFQPNQATEPRRINFIQALWTVAGEGRARIGAKDRAVRRGWAVFCFPDSEHRLASGDSGWEYRWCTLDGPCSAALTAAFGISGTPFAVGPGAESRFEALELALGNPLSDGEPAAGVAAYDFLTFMSGKARGGGGADSMAARAARDMLSVKQLAAETGTSRFTIHRAFKEELGIPPKRYLDSLRLREAMALLRETSQSVDEIAAATGFANANYFAKFFRKKTSFSPTQFREAGHLP